MNFIERAVAVRPHPRQAAWQETEFYAFIHFSPNTFTDREWGDGTEDPGIFDPTAFDAGQWVDVVKSAGMRGLILTAKHHDGFCLWPSAYTGHSVKNSPFGRDVVGEVAAACREGGIKLGIYCSPWDRHEPSYGDSPRYNEHFQNQLRELCTGYGELFSVWFDGACGEGPNGKRQVYDWESYYSLIRELQPNACISVCGPDTRWCGNEAGSCRTSEWSVVPAVLADQEKITEKSQKADNAAFRLMVDTQDQDLGSRRIIERADALVWYPAEVNTSIRPGWFYHAAEDARVKSLEHLLDVYYGSVGGNATFLLNFPPDRRGLIHENDAARAAELGAVLRRTFGRNLAAGASVTASHSKGTGPEFAPERCLDGDSKTFWTADDGQESARLEFELPESRTFDVAMLQECIREGQRIEGFRLDIEESGKWRTVAESTVVGFKRLLRFEPVASRKVRIEITASRIRPTLSAFGLYNSRI